MRLSSRPPDFGKRLKDIHLIYSNPASIAFLHECESEYWSWDRIRFTARERGLDPELVWSWVKLGRMTRYRELPLLGFGYQSLNYNTPDVVQQEWMMIDRELGGRLISDEESPMSATELERFLITGLQEEAIASSLLEGAATTRREAKEMLRTDRRPRTRGERMVLNNYRAIEFVRENRRVDLSLEFLIELQRILTEQTLARPDEAGRLRNANDRVLVVDQRDDEVLHTPPSAEELPVRIARICDFGNRSQAEFIHPVIKACILHFQIGFDHPFCDGNGRTARAIFYWHVLRSGYWLFEYMPISRLIYRSPAKYIRAFLDSEADDFDVTYFLLYNARIFAMARRELHEHIRRKQSQSREARKLLTSDRRLNHRQQELVLQAARNRNRVFTIAEHRGRHAVAYGTAHKDLLQLEQWGYLVSAKAGNRLDFRAGEAVARLSVTGGLPVGGDGRVGG